MALIAGVGVYWNRKEFKKFSLLELAGIAGLFIVVIGALACFFVFVASPLVNLITVRLLRFITVVLIIVGGLTIGLAIIQQGSKKIMNGRYPSRGMGEQMEVAENIEIQQLIDEGKVVQAVKVARKTYGYSLLEAKEYIDSFTANQ